MNNFSVGSEMFACASCVLEMHLSSSECWGQASLGGLLNGDGWVVVCVVSP